MKVSVVIPAYNEEKYIGACLTSVLAQTEPADEIIVVNNNSTDKTAKIAASFPGVTVITQKKKGTTYTRNMGFDTANGDIIVRTDADSRVPKNWIKRIKKHFEDDPQLVAYCGPSRFEDIPEAVQFKNWTVVGLNATFKQAVGHDLLYGPNMAITKAAWNKIRNEVCMNAKVVHEDVDLALHVAKYGRLVFDEKVVVTSSPRRWTKLSPYFEYPYRFIRTIQHHKQSMRGLKKSTDLVKGMIPRTRKLLKRFAQATNIY
jgi:glycosyltransferase involved in cell wall biosynthesis